METISIALICSVVGGIIGVASFSRNRDKDIKTDSKEDAFTKAKLDYISKGVDDIKLDFREQGRQITSINDRLIRVEESTKSAHHRIDTFEGKEEY